MRDEWMSRAVSAEERVLQLEGEARELIRRLEEAQRCPFCGMRRSGKPGRTADQHHRQKR